MQSRAATLFREPATARQAVVPFGRAESAIGFALKLLELTRAD